MSNVEGENVPSNDFNLPLEEMAGMEELSPIEASTGMTTAPLEPVGVATVDEAESEPREGFLAKLSRANPFTVLLGMSLAAILMAILVLFLELMTYDLDIKARKGKEGAMIAPAAQSAPASTIAAA